MCKDEAGGGGSSGGAGSDETRHGLHLDSWSGREGRRTQRPFQAELVARRRTLWRQMVVCIVMTFRVGSNGERRGRCGDAVMLETPNDETARRTRTMIVEWCKRVSVFPRWEIGTGLTRHRHRHRHKNKTMHETQRTKDKQMYRVREHKQDGRWNSKTGRRGERWVESLSEWLNECE